MIFKNKLEYYKSDIIGLDEQNIGVLRDYARQKLPVIIKNKLKAAA